MRETLKIDRLRRELAARITAHGPQTMAQATLALGWCDWFFYRATVGCDWFREEGEVYHLTDEGLRQATTKGAIDVA